MPLERRRRHEGFLVHLSRQNRLAHLIPPCSPPYNSKTAQENEAGGKERTANVAGDSFSNADSNSFSRRSCCACLLPCTWARPHSSAPAHEAPWLIYGMDWSNRRDKPFRLALGSFIHWKRKEVASDNQ